MRRPELDPGAGPVRGRWAAVREPVLDGAGAVLLWSAMAVALLARPVDAGQSPATPAAYLWAAVIAAPFVVHRHFPLIAIGVSDLGLIGYSLGRYSAFPGYATFALVFAVALHAGRRRGLTAYLLGAVGLIGALLLQPAGVATASSWISTLLTLTVGWLAGENLRARRERRRHELDEARREAEQRADEARRLLQRRAEDERRAIAAERLRIARDLHDVVAHSMSVIAVQAGVAHHVADERPEAARAALSSIEVVAREGLVELRRMLGVLRSPDGTEDTDAAPTSPSEGLRDLDKLLSHFAATGLRVEVTDTGPAADLPPALDVSAYRIIQEGLTNVLRHGGPVAELSLFRTPARLRIEIHDAGRPAGSAPVTVGSGHGIAGIRERAALFDGRVRAEPEPGGGFRLSVELPVQAVAVG
ncbi:sensor histidine kinase [Microlunatus ginsengisoli]|uniref:histidine kinase n=1 Tax=Microlunatus ginsengisoli TaxID=363863 RepID=A0ABP7ABB5_9ACTN